MFDDEIWFEAKRYGLGSGKPVHWKGWVLIGVHLLVLVASVLAIRRIDLALFGRHDIALLLIEACLIAGPMPLYVVHTRGGWRWRWGHDD